MSDKKDRRQSIYLPRGLRAEIDAEAKRLDRSFSWLMQYAWRVAKSEVAEMPTVEEVKS